MTHSYFKKSSMAELEDWCQVDSARHLIIAPNNKDLSQCFQRSVLQGILPGVLSFVILFWSCWRRIRHLAGRDSLASRFYASSYLEKARFFAAFAVFSVQIADFVVEFPSPSRPKFSYLAVIGIASWVPVFLLFAIELNKSQKRSVSLIFLLLVQFFAWAVSLRSSIREFDPEDVHSKEILALRSCVLILSFFVLVSHFILLQRIDRVSEYQVIGDVEQDLITEEVSPESQSNIIGIVTFAWMDQLFEKGFRKPLQEEDLFPLNTMDRSKDVSIRFQECWMSEVSKWKSRKSLRASVPSPKSINQPLLEPKPEELQSMPSLYRALARGFGSSFALAGVFKVVQDSLMLVGPVLLNKIVVFIKSSDSSIEIGIAYIVLLFFASFFQSVFLHQYFHICFRIGMHVRTALVTAIYQKALRLSPSARQEKTTGDIVNLMSIDAQRMQALLRNRFFHCHSSCILAYLHVVWSAPLQILVSLYLLWGQIGVSSLAGFGVMLLLVPLNAYSAKIMRQRQKELMQAKDQRVKLTNEVFSSIKVIKLYGWEQKFGEKISEVRENELRNLKRYNLQYAFQSTFWNSTPTLIALATFAVYSAIGNQLTAAKAFTTLALFNILRFPVSMLPFVVNNLVEASVSLKRLSSFLVSEEISERPSVISSPLDENSIYFKQASFSWDDAGNNMAIRDVSLVIPKGSLCMIVGSTGSGKTAFVSALLGELSCVSGEVSLVGSVAYTSQVPWIQNATVKDNILFGRQFDSSLFDGVVGSCALEPDLKILPAGIMTEIGERGINLSGGQRARVALARAVYSNADNIILDDPLSAVDTHVSKHIFEKCVLGFLSSKTRILVTNNTNILPFADQIIFLEQGRVAACGSFDDLSGNENFLKFIEELDTNDQEDTKVEDSANAIEKIDEEKSPEELVIRRQSSSKRTQDLEDKKPAVESAGKKLVEEESRQVGNVSWKVYSSYITASGGFAIAALVLVFLILQMSSDLGLSRWLAFWSDRAELKEHSSMWYLGIYTAIALALMFFNFVTVTTFALSSVVASRKIHDRMLSALLRAKMSFFDMTPLGRILNRFSKDQYVIDQKIFGVMYTYLSELFSVIGIIIAISSVTPPFLALLVPLGFLYYKIQNYYISTSRELMRLDSVLASPIFSHFSETLQGVSVIRAFKEQHRFLQINEERMDKSLRAYFPSIGAHRWLALRLESIGAFVVGSAGLFAVIGRGRVDAALAALSITYALSITQTLNWMVRMTSERETNIVSVERNQEYTSVESEASLVIQDSRPPINWPSQGKIDIEELCLRYRPGLDLVLNKFTCKIPAGAKVGIVGRTGAGKSSLMLALLRLVESESGRILIDGVDVGKIGIMDLRSRVSIIPQDPVLFIGTIRFNLDPFGERTDEQIWQSLKLAHIDSLIASLPGQLDEMVAEDGSNFSIGQKQLLCLARACLRKSKIILMDEATSSVSRDIGVLIQETVRTQFKDCTMLVIAHRLETVLQSDIIFVIEQGKLAESGPPEKLLANPKSLFSRLAESMKVTNSD